MFSFFRSAILGAMIALTPIFTSFAQVANSQPATLYVYKPKTAVSGVMRHTIQINGKELASMGNGSRMVYHTLESGTMTLTAESYVKLFGNIIRDASSDLVANIQINPGGVYYIKLLFDFEGHGSIRMVDPQYGYHEFIDENLYRKGEEIMERYGYDIDAERPAITPPQPPIAGTQPAQRTEPERPLNYSKKSDVDEEIPQAKAPNPDAIAIVIGNRDYTHKDVPDVDFAVDDARSMRLYLTEALGFLPENVFYYENADQSTFFGLFGTKDNFKARLYNLVKAGKSDVFIYYSGHGAPDVESKEGYFVPSNCDPSLVQFNGYPVNTFYANLGQIPFKSLTVVIDACFSGVSESGMLIRDVSPIYIQPKIKILNDERVTLFTSSKGDQVSNWHREQGHSLFTYYFLKGLQGAADKDQNKAISVGEMSSYLSDEVPYMARRLNNRSQTPEIHGLPDKKMAVY